MIQLFKSLLGEPNRSAATKKIARDAPLKSCVGGDYRAVSISACPGCRAAANDTTGKRYLLRDAPSLPMAGCTLGVGCRCKFRKHADRRDADRRMLGEMETRRWFAGVERRGRGRRRPATL